MRHKRRFWALVLATVTVAFTFVGCNKPENSIDNNASTDNSIADDTTTDKDMTTGTEAPYTYEGIEAWDVEYEEYGGLTERDIMAFMASPDCDMDAYVHSPNGEFALVSQSLIDLSLGDISSQENIDYWKAIGLDKECHDLEDPERQWTSFIPVSAHTSNEVYPVLFVWHGNDNPLLMAETYGFLEVAAKNEYIVVMPWANNDDDYLEEFDRIFDYIKVNYPIDETRIYTTGFSKGGRVSAHLALERSNIIAAAVANGTDAAAQFMTEDGELQLTGPQALTPEDFAQAENAVPLQIWGGDCDVYHAMPYTVDYKVNAVNEWLTLYGHEANQVLGAESSNDVESKIGLTFDEVEIRNQDMANSYIGTYYVDGKMVSRYICAENAIHWPTQYMSELTFEFIGHYQKDISTGKTIVAE